MLPHFISWFGSVLIGALLGGGGIAAAALATQQPGRSAIASNMEHAMLLLGEVLCAYTLSSAMLMRAQLPVKHRVLGPQHGAHGLPFVLFFLFSSFLVLVRCLRA